MIKLCKKKHIIGSEKGDYEYRYDFEAYLPDVIKTSYHKKLNNVWEATVEVLWNEKTESVINGLKDYLFQIYDYKDEYIGAFLPTTKDTRKENGNLITSIKCNHVLITLMDSILSDELKYDAISFNRIIEQLLTYQKSKWWSFEGTAIAEELNDIDLKKQSGLLNPLLTILGQLPPLYYMEFDTEEHPWKMRLVKATDIPTVRVREGYNLTQNRFTEDSKNIYNRLYPYGETDVITGGARTGNNQEEYDKETKAWQQYQKDYEAWKQNQLKMQKEYDAALEQRRKRIEAGEGSVVMGDLPIRPSQIKPPEKPSMSTREMEKQPVNISSINPTGKEYIEDQDSIDAYGLKERYVEYKDIGDPELLYNAALREFEAREGVVYDYSISAIDLNKILVDPIPFNWIRLGKTVSLQTTRNGKEIEDDYIITEESKDDIDSQPYNIKINLQAKSAHKPAKVYNSPVTELLAKIEETNQDLILTRMTADGKNTIYTGKDEPPNPKVNDIWYKQTVDETGKTVYEMWIFNGDIWVNPFESLEGIEEAIRRNEKEIELYAKSHKNDIDKLLIDVDEKILNADFEKAQELVANEIAKAQMEFERTLDNFEEGIRQEIDENNNTIRTSIGQQIDEANANQWTEFQQEIDENNNTIRTTIAQQWTEFQQSLDGFKIDTAQAIEDSKGEVKASLLSTINADLESINLAIATNKQNLQDQEQTISSLRVSQNEIVMTLGGQIDYANNNITQANITIQTLSESIQSLTKDIEDIDGNTTRQINEVKRDLGSVQDTIAERITTMNNRIDSLDEVPVYTIGSNGYWYKDGVMTSIRAQGTKGPKGDSGQDGKNGINGQKGDKGDPGEPGKDGKNAEVYTRAYAPSDKTKVWYNPNTKQVKIFDAASNQWVNVAQNSEERINTLQRDLDSTTSTISILKNDVTTKYSQLQQTVDSVRSEIKNQDYLSIINQQADRIIFNVSSYNSNKGKLQITPETVYIQDATIESSKIKNLSANKITTGTLNGKNINVINLNASAISTGRLTGTEGYWDLDSGKFYNGSYSSNITINDGTFQFRSNETMGLNIDKTGLTFYGPTSGSSSSQYIGVMTYNHWKNYPDITNINLAHRQGTTLTISYYSSFGTGYNPYMTFDHYREADIFSASAGAEIEFWEQAYFEKGMSTIGHLRLLNDTGQIRFNNGIDIAQCEVRFGSSTYESAIYLGPKWKTNKPGLFISTRGVWFWDTQNHVTTIVGETITARRKL